LTSLHGYLVFERSGNIWAKPIAGGAAVALTDVDVNVVVVQSPAVSPDGLRVAFNESVPGQYDVDIAVLSIGGSLQPFFPGGRKYEPSWSPDGTHLAFGAPDISIYGGAILSLASDAQSSTIDMFIHSSSYEFPRAPAWSPDGLSMAFHFFRSGGTGPRHDVVAVRIDDPDGSFMVVDSNATDPSWAPTGDRLAYTKSGNIWVSTIDGEESYQLTFCEESCGHPAWSPDGEFIAFEQAGDIWLVRPDGSGLVNFTNTPAASESEPAWGPLTD